ncbi:hypothetical protein [Peribacillus sp. FSL E2-0218]|uniref:hypothetical protein n=1 Tax=Peribacillus sp. FSL E2-0218 TaxID=2921364 RepID=UPI0030EE046D
MNKLGFQANPAQMLSQPKLPLRQRQIIPQGFQHHFQAAAVSPIEKLTISNMRI